MGENPYRDIIHPTPVHFNRDLSFIVFSAAAIRWKETARPGFNNTMTEDQAGVRALAHRQGSYLWDALRWIAFGIIMTTSEFYRSGPSV